MGGVRQWPAPDSVASGGASMQSQNRNPKRFLKKQDLIKSGLLAAAAVFTCSAHAQDDSSWWDGVSFSLGGFIRPEVAVSTSSSDNFARSEEHTSELQSLMSISYAVFCLKKKSRYMQVLTDVLIVLIVFPMQII